MLAITIPNQNVKIYRGNSAMLQVALTQADGTPFDPVFGIHRIKWRLARTSHAIEEEVLVRKDLDDGGIQIGDTPADGIFIDLMSGDTDFIPGLYYHELKVWDGVDVYTAMTGTFVIKWALPMGDRVSPISANVLLSGDIPTVT